MSKRPVRVQLKREKGWRLPPNTVCVTRPGRWGNPILVDMWKNYTAAAVVRDYLLWILRDSSRPSLVDEYGEPPSTHDIRRYLRGKNLACWCKPGDPCHADVLLEIANSEGAA